MLPVFLGYDAREREAYDVCEYSILSRTKRDVRIYPLEHRQLRKAGLFTRPWRIDEKGAFWDERDQRPFSTEFAHSRFLVPFYASRLKIDGAALFMDCDMLLRGDIGDVFDLFDPSFALQCVQHLHEPPEGMKMDDQYQLRYRRKNWSSFVLWNLDHPAHDVFHLEDANTMPGAWLHAFQWLPDELVGTLPQEWNVLAGYTKLPDGVEPKNIHYTDGVPIFEGYEHVPYADVWQRESAAMKQPRISTWERLRAAQ